MRWMMMFLLFFAVAVCFENAYAEEGTSYAIALSVRSDVSSIANMCDAEIRNTINSKVKAKFVSADEGHFLKVDVVIIQGMSKDGINGYSMASAVSVRHIMANIHASMCQEFYDYMTKKDSIPFYVPPLLSLYESPNKNALKNQCRNVAGEMYSNVIKPWEDGFASIRKKQ